MKLQIVIVDDSDIVIFLHTEILSYSKLSSNPLSALNGQQALDLITSKEAKDVAYLILLDINMPVMDGWQFLESLGTLQDPPTVHVVIVTSSIDSIDKKKAAKYSNVIGFFEKPLTQENCAQMKQFDSLKHFFDQGQSSL